MSIKIVILGLLMEGPKHPYEMQQIFKQRKMERYINFQKGSLYYAVNILEQKEHIAVDSIVKESNRPDKTIYKITPSGKELFYELLNKQFMVHSTYNNPLNAALAFIEYMDKDNVIGLLQTRIDHTLKAQEQIRHIFDESKERLNRSGMHIFEGSLKQIETELEWLNDILRDAKLDRLVE